MLTIIPSRTSRVTPPFHQQPVSESITIQLPLLPPLSSSLLSTRPLSPLPSKATSLSGIYLFVNFVFFDVWFCSFNEVN
nr:hypothetical protein [Tanacetum cinerariifolium]